MAILADYHFLASCCFFTGALCLFLAFLVLRANVKSMGCRLTFMLNLFVSFWAFSFGSMLLSGNETWGLMAAKCLTVFINFLNTFFTHLVIHVTKKEKTWKKFVIINYSIAGVLSLMTLVTPYIVAGSPPKMIYPSYIEGGPLYFLTAAFLCANVAISIYNLLEGIKKAKGYQKTKIALFLAASSLGYAAGLPAYFLAFNIPIKPLSLPFVCLFPIILSYAIVRHRFLDIRKLVKNTFIFTLLFVSLLVFASFVLFVLRELMTIWLKVPDSFTQAAAIALALILYTPLKKALSRITQKMLYLHNEDPQNLFEKLSADMFQYLKTKELAEVVTKRISETLALNRISFYARPHKTSQFFELIAHQGTVRKTRIHHGNAFILTLENSKEPLNTPPEAREFKRISRKKNYAGKANFLSNPKLIKEEGARFLITLGGSICYPIFFKETLFAILVLGHKKSDIAFSNEELQILKSFVRHLSLAFNNTRYAEVLKHSYEEMHREDREMTGGAIISGIEHEVRTPLHVITLTLTDLKDSTKIENGPLHEARELIDESMTDVLQATKQIDKIIEHLSILANRKPLLIEDNIHPQKIASQVIKDLVRRYPHVSINSRIAPNITVTCDTNALYEILMNLIKNACEACPDEHGEVILEGEQNMQEAVISVRDNGCGISPVFQNKIFEPFYTTKQRSPADEQSSGSGMGLFIVKENMEGMKGRIEVHSLDGNGTVFKLHFPSFGALIKEAV